MEKINLKLYENVHKIKEQFANDDTVKYRYFQNMNISYVLIFIDGMVKSSVVNENVIKPILENKKPVPKKDALRKVSEEILYSCDIKKISTFKDIYTDILYGNSILLIENEMEAISIDTKGFALRSIDEPDNDKITKGPREGFTENILTNLSLLRRKIQTPNLKFEFQKIGDITNTRVCIAYIKTNVDKEVLKELKKRISKIKMNGILDVNYITECIKDNRFSPFKTTGAFEKPDIVAAKLLEGKVAVIVDGSPIVMTVPYLFLENFTSGDDYYLNYYFASFSRIIRLVSFYIAICIPALYVAIITFHKEILPSSLAINIMSARKGLPYSTFTECILMIILFEILREAGMRTSSGVSTALGIVGGIVVGQAAVDASLISAPMIIVVALSAISELMIPRIKGATILLRFIFVFACALFGIYGFFICIFALLIHLCNLSSFNMPYTANIVRVSCRNFQDAIIRFPWFKKEKY